MAAFCSCSSNAPEMNTDAMSVIINGTVSDISSNEPLEGVKIVFKAYNAENPGTEPIVSMNAYTDSKGVFNIKSDGYTSAILCEIDAEHPGYSDVTKEIYINWNGTSFDEASLSFFVNDCDFHLEKKKQ